MGHRIILWISILFLLSHTVVFAEEEGNPYSFEALSKISKTLDTAEGQLKLMDKQPDTERLAALTTQGTQIEQTAQACITQAENQKKQLQTSIESLGQPTSEIGEDYSVREKRSELNKQQEFNEQQLAQCRLIALRSNALAQTSKELRQQLLKKFLLSRDLSVFHHVQNLLLNPLSIQATLSKIKDSINSLSLDWANLRFGVFYGFLGLLLGSAWIYHHKLQNRHKPQSFESSSPTLFAVWRSVLKLTPILLFTGFMSLAFKYYPPGLEVIYNGSLFTMFCVAAYAIMRAPLQSGVKLSGFIPLESKDKRRVHHSVNLLALTSLVKLFVLKLPIETTQHPLLGLLHISLDTLISLTAIRTIWLLSAYFLTVQRLRLHWITTLILVVAIGASWSGYINITYFLISATLGTLFVLLILWLLLRIPSEIFDGLDEGRMPWQRALKQRIGSADDPFFPGLVWVRLVVVLTLNALALISILLLWGMSEQTILVIWNQLLNGIPIGKITLEPIRILAGILMIGVIIGLTQVFKKNLAENWLKRTRLSRGAREAITTIFGYIGMLAAFLMGLSIAGLQFQNLAIIAGALSVGIGFGLQNIVNNFVSGLILLFERPIRRGDWIRVGGAEGYVKDISIRSTTIQNFDRADIIVPNSELISGQVTNMFLHDNFGRIIIPIRVAYGTSVELVMKSLMDLAKAHKDIIQHHPEMQPTVLFRSFGDYALQFELRCFIRNIDQKMSITSELNIGIERTFREQKIVIPFPQQMVHLNQTTSNSTALPAGGA